MTAGRIFYRCVDWNFFCGFYNYFSTCRIFYRCVDWNLTLIVFIILIPVSHLLQMRGLKQKNNNNSTQSSESHLLQMRGLKRFWKCAPLMWYKVASFTDAWIETININIWICVGRVASFTDAWIETACALVNWTSKPVASFTDAWIETDWLPSPGGIAKVASFTDAWIETFNPEFDHIGYQSHLLQMRGLKPSFVMRKA